MSWESSGALYLHLFLSKALGYINHNKYLIGRCVRLGDLSGTWGCWTLVQSAAHAARVLRHTLQNGASAVQHTLCRLAAGPYHG